MKIAAKSDTAIFIPVGFRNVQRAESFINLWYSLEATSPSKSGKRVSKTSHQKPNFSSSNLCSCTVPS